MKALSLSILSILAVLCLCGSARAQSQETGYFIIERVEYNRPHLQIIGSGFADKTEVSVNGKDCTRFIVKQSGRKIVLAGNEEKLNINSSLNRVEVKSGRADRVFLVAGLQPKRLGAISPQADTVQNIQVEVGSSATIEIRVKDDTSVTVDFKCDRGNFVTLKGFTLMLDPTNSDIGVTTCTLSVTDSFNLTTTASIFITVIPCGQPVAFNLITEQVIKVGEVRDLELRANDPCGMLPITLSLTAAPKFVSFNDRGNGTGTLRIAPKTGDVGGQVLVDARDAIGLSGFVNFGIAVRIGSVIQSVNYAKPNLIISGAGFGTGGAQVFVNNVNLSSRITIQNDTQTTLRGNKKKLNLKPGPNLIRLIPAAAGAEPLEFVFDF